MSLILNIDTSIDEAYINISKNGICLVEAKNTAQKDHAGFVQKTIQQLIQQLGITLHELDAIAVTEGPGSYTGLRVGMSSAKGLCYALNKPLITIGTLSAMANSKIAEFKRENKIINAYFIPMIDARRMEVYSAVYNFDNNIIQPPNAVILTPEVFDTILLNHTCYFFGNGATKWRTICKHPNAYYIPFSFDAFYLSSITYHCFIENKFSNIAYAEPFYLKEFYSTFTPGKI